MKNNNNYNNKYANKIRQLKGDIMGRVKINPKMLTWAREDAGYTFETLPKNLQKNFIYWEKGKKQPTWNQLCDISNKLKRPTAFFFRKNPPKTDKINLVEYRKTNMTIQTRSPQLNLAIRQFNYKRENRKFKY